MPPANARSRSPAAGEAGGRARPAAAGRSKGAAGQRVFATVGTTRFDQLVAALDSEVLRAVHAVPLPAAMRCKTCMHTRRLPAPAYAGIRHAYNSRARHAPAHACTSGVSCKAPTLIQTVVAADTVRWMLSCTPALLTR